MVTRFALQESPSSLRPLALGYEDGRCGGERRPVLARRTGAWTCHPHTAPGFRRARGSPPNARVGIAIDHTRFIGLLEDALASYP
jgi:hypothetical protein